MFLVKALVALFTYSFVVLVAVVGIVLVEPLVAVLVIMVCETLVKVLLTSLVIELF